MGIIDRLFEALKGGKWRVLWALPSDNHSWIPEDISPSAWRIESFVPQIDILRCDRVKCFVSHCGANSTMECLSAGVPMVCHPFYLDQYEWARTVTQSLGAGIQIDKLEADASVVRLAVSEILENPSFAANAQAVSNRLHAQNQALQKVLGRAMIPKETMGPGVCVVAAAVVSLLKGKHPKVIIDLLK